MPLSAPVPLADHHDLAAFSSGEPSLDDWLRRRARANQVSGASRTFVAAEENRVVAYYAMASGGIDSTNVKGSFRRNMPNPVPIALLGRLAVDRTRQGLGLGKALIRDCATRVSAAADIIGIRGIVVHAITLEARAFYLAVGFEPSPNDPMLLMITLNDIRAILAQTGT